MSKQELIARQQQLERLEQEGKSVYQARTENEIVLFQAVENEIDNEAQTPLLDKADLVTGLERSGKGVSEAPPQKEKSKKVPISREDFILGIEDQIEHWEEVALGAKLSSLKQQNILRKVYELEELGHRISFYEERDEEGNVLGLGFTSRQKGKFGFQAKVKNSIEDAGTWKGIQEERNRKKEYPISGRCVP